MSKWNRVLVSAVAGVLAVGTIGFAQDQGRDRGGDRRGNFDPAQMRQRMMDRLKEQLGSSDEEWKALEPKLEKVMTARRDAGGGGGGFFGFGGGRGGRGGEGATLSPVARASQELRQTLENKSASADEISRKLAALRDAREKARQSLNSSQKELKELLTQRQEATLVVAGMLE